MAQLLTDLQGLTVAAGYSQTVVDVTREDPNESDLAKANLPAIWLYGGPEPKSVDTMGQQTNLLELNVVALCKTHGDQEQVGLELLADVETILVTANARVIAASTVDILPRGNLVLIGNEDRELAGGHAQFEITYRTELGAPRTAA